VDAVIFTSRPRRGSARSEGWRNTPA